MRGRGRVALGILLLAATSAAFGQTYEGVYPLSLGPIPEITVGWHPAPAAISVPVGRTLAFYQEAPEEARVTWNGALEERRDAAGSWATCPLEAAGTLEVKAGVELADGTRFARRIVVTVVDQPVSVIEVRDVEARVKPMPLDEESPNERVVDFFKRTGSVAQVRSDGEGGWITSVRKGMRLQAEVVPAVAASIMEWRLDGEPIGLGPTLDWTFTAEGDYRMAVGPPAAEVARRMQIYRVVGRHPKEIVDGEPVELTAVTIPPGHEEQVTWLAATLYGDASPRFGSGPELTTTFTDTWGDLPGGVRFRWVGVKADDATFDGDDKCPVSVQGACATVTITDVDICGDSVTTLLSSQGGLTGLFTLVLSGPGGAQQTLVSASRGDGSYTDGFGLANLPVDQEFDTLTATWAVVSPTPTDTATAHLMSLGNYRHTQYNCPSEADGTCAGTDEDVCFSDPDPQCSYDPGMLPDTFVDTVSNPLSGTGCGTTVDHGDIQLEFFCSSPPPGCTGELFRENTTITGSCGSGVNDSTVAVSPTDLAGDLPCGTNLCIRNNGQGSVKTVNDRCPACEGATKIDNFTTDDRCSGVTDYCASCLTIKLF